MSLHPVVSLCPTLALANHPSDFIDDDGVGVRPDKVTSVQVRAKVSDEIFGCGDAGRGSGEGERIARERIA